MLRFGLFVLFFIASAISFADEPLQFGVLNQRSILLTAEIWNPILQYVSAKSGVPLMLKMGKTAQETTAMTVRGEFDFIYTNHLFTPERDKLHYYPIARFDTPGIRAQIVTLADSPYRTLADLQGRRVAFPTPDGFAGYRLPMDALLKAGVKVQPIFTGNQEAAMSRMQYGHVAAVGVNSALMASYAQRESLKYRVLYSSRLYLDLPIMVNPRVPAEQVRKVREALLGMAHDSAGRQILQVASSLLNSKQVLGFVGVDDRDYENYRQFYRTALVKE
ncbi:MAG: phosphate/phosphite/phosphonate ABC transporter substrate-binding protein [Sulfuriferula sp.]|nr:phosphate/phosphite/phosphonate ABC transporter substrate-binding protein [Sulfuriferula sp.]